MKVQDEINRIMERVKAAHKMIEFLSKYRMLLEDLDTEIQAFSDHNLDINDPSREVLTKGMLKFGGKWNKSISALNETHLDYTQEIEGIQVRFYNAPPPPSCRIEEVDEIIPAQPQRIEKRKKLICNEV